MEIRYLETFVQVAERGSFTKAAEALSYTQSTVSTQIKQLETELNTQLFERINHTVKLTDTGRALLERAHEIINLVEEVRSVSLGEEEHYEPVRFAMAPSICGVMMGQTYLDFKKMYPTIPVKILEADTENLLAMLDRNDVDLAFIVDRREFSNNHVVAFEKKEGVHFVVGKGSALIRKKDISIEEILKEPFFLSEEGLSYRKLLEERLSEMNLAVNPIVEIGNTKLLLELVELGGGVSFLPDYVTRQSHDEGRVEYLDVKDFDIEIWCQLIYHKNKWLYSSMKKVINYCADVAKKLL